MGRPTLIKKTIDDIDVFFAPDSIWLSGNEGLDIFKQGVIQRYLENTKHVLIVNDYAKKNNLKGICVLSADCAMSDDKWMFSDCKNWYDIQSWINNKDGRYAALMIESISERKLMRSQKSIIISNLGNFSVIGQASGTESLELYIPRTGVIDAYNIDSYIEKYVK